MIVPALISGMTVAFSSSSALVGQNTMTLQPESGISGTFTGLTNDTLWIRVGVWNEEYRLEPKGMDTAVVRNGKLFYDPHTNNLTELTIIPLESIDRLPNGMISYGPGASIVLLYSPGDHIYLNVSYEDDIVAYQAKGNSYNELLSMLTL